MGHTPGFTFYIFENILLICDYVFVQKEGMIFNPYGPQRETRECAFIIDKILQNREISKVCGYNYVLEYREWRDKFNGLLVWSFCISSCKKDSLTTEDVWKEYFRSKALFF